MSVEETAYHRGTMHCNGNVLDECGVCGGDGIPAGDCDYDGNQLDALGECGGPCEADTNGNGVCDDAEIAGCADDDACNYDSSATEDDGSCDYCSCGGQWNYPLVVESSPAVESEGTVYRFFVQMQNATDALSSVYGNGESGMWVYAPSGAFNSEFDLSWNASTITPTFLSVFPDLADDTYATVGLSRFFSSGVSDAQDPLLSDFAITEPIELFFTTHGATSLKSDEFPGSSWYVTYSLGSPAANALPDSDGRVLVMQVTTTGSVYGRLN